MLPLILTLPWATRSQLIRYDVKDNFSIHCEWRSGQVNVSSSLKKLILKDLNPPVLVLPISACFPNVGASSDLSIRHSIVAFGGKKV
jgi:hypothetical protein